MGVEINGMGDVFDDLDELERNFGSQTEDWVVGTTVNYAVFLEFGAGPHTIEANDADALRFETGGDVVFAKKVRHPGNDPEPFFRPTIAEVRLKGVGDFIEDNTRLEVATLSSTRELVIALAFAIERRIKETITRKGLIDTGTLRASVRAVPLTDIDSLPSADEVEGGERTTREIEI